MDKQYPSCFFCALPGNLGVSLQTSPPLPPPTSPNPVWSLLSKNN